MSMPDWAIITTVLTLFFLALMIWAGLCLLFSKTARKILHIHKERTRARRLRSTLNDAAQNPIPAVSADLPTTLPLALAMVSRDGQIMDHNAYPLPTYQQVVQQQTLQNSAV